MDSGWPEHGRDQPSRDREEDAQKKCPEHQKDASVPEHPFASMRGKSHGDHTSMLRISVGIIRTNEPGAIRQVWTAVA
jgi:hypothetical protein